MRARRGDETRFWSGICLASVCLTVAGCDPNRQFIIDLQKQINAWKVENIELTERLERREARIESLKRQLQNLRDRGIGRPEPVFAIERTRILDITCGIDLDEQAGDDAVAVYLRPVDREGDVLKRAGQITVDLLDTSQAGAPRSLGATVINDPAQLRAMWFGKFWTHYYKIVAPFNPGVDLTAGQEIDIRVTFIDFATGREFTARKAVKINVSIPDD